MSKPQDDESKKAFDEALEWFKQRGATLSMIDLKLIKGLIDIELEIKREQLKRKYE